MRDLVIIARELRVSPKQFTEILAMSNAPDFATFMVQRFDVQPYEEYRIVIVYTLEP